MDLLPAREARYAAFAAVLLYAVSVLSCTRPDDMLLLGHAGVTRRALEYH